MDTLTATERHFALTRIAGVLDRQRQEAQRAGADKLARLIAGAMAEAALLLANPPIIP